MFWENSIEPCILSRVKQITSPGGMHETSAQAWCTRKTQRNQVEREVGGGIGIGNTCNSMADSCQCMTKPTAMLWISLQLIKINEKKKKAGIVHIAGGCRGTHARLCNMAGLLRCWVLRAKQVPRSSLVPPGSWAPLPLSGTAMATRTPVKSLWQQEAMSAVQRRKSKASHSSWKRLFKNTVLLACHCTLESH